MPKILIVDDETFASLELVVTMYGEKVADQLDDAMEGGSIERLYTEHSLHVSAAKKALETKVVTTGSMIEDIVMERRSVFPHDTRKQAVDALLVTLADKLQNTRMLSGWSAALERAVCTVIFQVVEMALRQKEDEDGSK